MKTFSRRSFLASSAIAACGAAASAIEPMPRAGKPRLLLSLAGYSFREFFTDGARPAAKAPPADKAMDMFKFVDYCGANGCDGAEVTSYYFPKDVPTDWLVQLRRHAFLRGVGISGTAIGNNFSHPKGEKRDREIALCKQWIDRAAVLGTSHIRVFAGQTRELPREEADALVISALEECCDYAGSRGIFLGIENHDAIGSAEHLLKLIKPVKSRWLGVNLDSGNFRTEHPYDDFAKCVPYAVNVQVKTEIRRAGANANEPADLPRLVKAMRDGGYQGWVALEYEAKEDPFTTIPPVLRKLKELMSF